MGACDTASTGEGSETYDLVRFYASNASYDLPHTFGRLGNNRYDSARIELHGDGSYRFTLWQVLGNPYI